MAIDCEVVPDSTLTGQGSSTHTFDALPRVGEIIHVMHEGDQRRFRVVRVEHTPVKAQSSRPSTQIIVADATGNS